MKLDWTGFIAISLLIVAAQLIMDRGQRLDWFESYEILAYVALIVLSGWVFVIHTATHPHPFINPQLFKDRNFIIGLFLVFSYGMLNITPTVLMPSMLQNLMGYPDSVVGMILGARGLGMALGFLVVGYMGKVDPRVGMIAGMTAIGISGWNMSLFTLDVDPWTVGLNGFLQGVGSGLCWVPLSIVAFASLPLHLLPDASSLFHLLRNFGSSIFISISVLTVVRSGRTSYSELTQHVNPYSETMALPQLSGLWSFDTVAGLSVLESEIDRQATMVGYLNSFTMYALVAFVVIPPMMLARIKMR